jgi:hypothetical protein
MSRPDPIQYAERLYAAIRAANFSPISFLAFGSAVKDGVEFRRMPRIAAEPFMRVVGEMLDLEMETAEVEVIEAEPVDPKNYPPRAIDQGPAESRTAPQTPTPVETAPPTAAASPDQHIGGGVRSR